jgi:hypothetical protein
MLLTILGIWIAVSLLVAVLWTLTLGRLRHRRTRLVAPRSRAPRRTPNRVAHG